MNLSQEKALYHLTGHRDHNPVSLASIQQIAEEYPYFAPAQSLLAYQFKKEEHPMVVLQTLRTALYFTNPYWLQYQLHDDNLIRPKLRVEPPIAKETVSHQEEEPVMSEIPLAEPEVSEKEPDPVIEEEIPETIAPTIERANPEPILIAVDEAIPTPPADIFPEGEPVLPAQPVFTADMAIPTVEAVKEMMRKIDPVSEAEQEANETIPEEEAEQGWPAIEEADLESGNKIASLLSEQFADFKKPVEDDAKLDIETTQEKLHTIDYFASQGIKIDLANVPQDKLTSHLRKFTDWLKQVKQGEVNPKDLIANIEMEQQVVKTAQISNEGEEIITEAMAEVLEKQGQSEKAIEVYAKLSFLNPEKSSYFATKIEHLKGI